MAGKIKKTNKTKLTDKEKKKIIADYTNNGNKSETARMNGVTDTTVKRVLESCEPEVLKLVEQKKEESTQDVLAYVDSVKEDVKEILKLSLDRLKDKLKQNDKFVSPKDIVIVYGTLLDKEIKILEASNNKSSQQDTLNKLDELLKEQENA